MSVPTVITRFAPSPTGFLHIGGARTALFNWLFARHHGGLYRLRIEDTDRVRSTPEAIAAILDGLAWLGLNHDDEVVYQFARRERHAEVARHLLDQGKAYLCYCSPEDLRQMRKDARAAGRSVAYDGRWRDRDPAEAPAGVHPVVRLKMPRTGETTLSDLVQGPVTVPNGQLDDMILLRADGTPTYMLSVVVDDYDMGVTHVIRGDDHLTNAFRQVQLFRAMDWTHPEFAHIPLIHGPDGAKLSKRHGTLGVESYRDELGYLPEALRNYLLRLGWGKGDEEIIATEQAIEWFDLIAVGKSPSRFDFAKLDHLNGHYLRHGDDGTLVDLVAARLNKPLSDEQKATLIKAMPGLKERAKNVIDLSDSALFYLLPRPLEMNEKARKILDDAAREQLFALHEQLDSIADADWTADRLAQKIKDFAEKRNVKLGKVAQPVRAALSGRNVSPSVFEVMVVLGKAESLGRIVDQASTKNLCSN